MPKSFTELYFALSETNRSEEKISLISAYLGDVAAEEFGWTVYLLQGGSCRGPIKTKQLREWAAEVSGVPLWLLEESYGVVGDLAETISLLVSQQTVTPVGAQNSDRSLLSWIRSIQDLHSADPATRKERILAIWRLLGRDDLLVFTKIVTGGLRIGVSKGVVARALARLSGQPYEGVWLRLSGDWQPEELSRETLVAPLDSKQSATPYPFFLAHPFERDTIKDCSLSDWQIEWKWDGIRAQFVKRSSAGMALWSRGDELISEGFPEIVEAGRVLPEGTVLDRELVAWAGDHPGTFFDLQKRIHRRRITPALIRSIPVRYLIYDVLEYDGVDQRRKPLAQRSELVSQLIAPLVASTPLFAVPGPLRFHSWDEVITAQQAARERHAEGLMLKRVDSSYGVGRTMRGAWWKWKVDPFSVDAVLLYAQKGHGRRADLFTDYTFGVWDEGVLVTFAKAYSGLTDKELKEIDAFIKRNTEERFGPVRTVKPELVFEIAFEGIQRSSRHRSGVAVRFPRIVRWRRDKPASEADTLQSLRALVGEG
jgi:DNA ligase-1